MKKKTLYAIILPTMNKTMLIAGKKFPDCSSFADGVVLANRNVMMAADMGKIKEISSEMEKYFDWNENSSLSARSFILQGENSFGQIDEAVLYFDAVLYSVFFKDFTLENCTRTADVLIKGFLYISYEILTRFRDTFQRSTVKKPGKLVFLLRPCPTKYETVRTGLKTSGIPVSDLLTAAAAAAFSSFAENFAATYTEEDFIRIILARCDNESEIYRKDTELAAWLCSYLDSLDCEKSESVSKKQSLAWVRSGTKGPAGFNLFFKTH